jgi:NAD(P)-dependent dehydrogenase (short-subunit alcohol dehydrogenase family)
MTIKRLGRHAMPVSADVSQEDEVQGMFRQVFEEFGTIDILVNNAGVQVDAPIDEMTVQQWSRVIDTNLTGQFLCSREAIKEFKRRGVVKKVSSSAGKIIFISSVHEIIPWAGHANYAASKGGVMLLMKSIAQEVAACKIRVNSICPGDWCGGNGADVVIECSGAPAAARTLTDVACRGGRFCQMGIYGKAILFDQDGVCYKELVVTGTNASVTPAWTRAVKLLVERKVDAHRLITHRFAIADWNKALEVTKNKEGVKVILKPDGQ